MSAAIQTLPPEVIDIIAAGEVIDSPAAAVRELVENAIDAGADRITLAFFLRQWRLQITDNGRGMIRADLRRCAQPHSTSKIRSPADLWQITSLGFRGEALHSLAQLAQLEIRSRTADGEGWCMVYNPQGEVMAEEVVAIAPGTIVQVRDLFGSVPVRRHSLPPLSQQLKEIQTVIYHAALCHPQVNWQVWQEEQLWLQIYAGETVQAIAPQLLRRVTASDLRYHYQTIPLPDPAQSAALELLVGLPDRCHRRRPDWVKVAVNGRWVRSPQLEQALVSSFARTLPRDRYPLCFLHLHLPPTQIDWHRHPAKTELYLQQLEFWRSHVQEALGQLLRLQQADSLTPLLHPRLEQLLKTAEAGAAYRLDRQIEPGSTPTPDRQPLRAVGQVNQTYIVAEHAHGLWLVEQHIAHERVLYEQLQTAWELIAVEPPLLLPLAAPQVDNLQALGLTVEPFGEGLWAVRTMPRLLRDRTDGGDAILELSQGGDLQAAQVATACRCALRNGTPLSLPEMQTLLDQWQATRQPRTCPHGRPIFLALEETSLARFFRRHWVIGKSHGI